MCLISDMNALLKREHWDWDKDMEHETVTFGGESHRLKTTRSTGDLTSNNGLEKSGNDTVYKNFLPDIVRKLKCSMFHCTLD